MRRAASWEGGCIELPMTLRRRVGHASAKGRTGARRIRDLLSLPVICVHDEDEREPVPIRRRPIISVNGRDIPRATKMTSNHLK